MFFLCFLVNHPTYFGTIHSATNILLGIGIVAFPAALFGHLGTWP